MRDNSPRNGKNQGFAIPQNLKSDHPFRKRSGLTAQLKHVGSFALARGCRNSVAQTPGPDSKRFLVGAALSFFKKELLPTLNP
jgi:hypothetical protein